MNYILINLSMHDPESQVKARKVAVSFSGFSSLALLGKNGGYIEVKGKGIDGVTFIKSIRKVARHAELVSSKPVTVPKDYHSQKIVIKVPKDSGPKAMAIVGRFSGVLSMALQGKDLELIEVIGRGIDIVELTATLIKKKVQAELMNLTPMTASVAHGYCPGERLSRYYVDNYKKFTDLKKISIQVNGNDYQARAMATAGDFPRVLSVTLMSRREAVGCIEVIGRKVEATKLVASIQNAELRSLIPLTPSGKRGS